MTFVIDNQYDGSEKLIKDFESTPPVLYDIDEHRNNPKNIANEKKSGRNLIINGENYNSLSILNYTHCNKIDFIYIDPPYNTGNKSFMYNDKYINEGDQDRHLKWASFMKSRLEIAKNLLKDEGVIAIQIDETELFNLKLLMDSIFIEQNFIKMLSVEMSATQGMKVKAAQQGTIVKNMEYILLYAKNKQLVKDQHPFRVMGKIAEYDTHYTKIIINNQYAGTLYDYVRKSFSDFSLKINKAEKISKNIVKYEYANNEKFRSFIHGISKIIFYPSEFKVKYKFSDQEIEILNSGKIIDVTHGGRSYKICKNRNGNINQLLSLSGSIGDISDISQNYGVRTIRGDFWGGYHKDMINVRSEGGKDFKNGKKPIRLIKDLIKLINRDNMTILDFFAGSGSTGHAVLEMNALENTNHKFILCTNDCRGICTDITIPRIKNVYREFKEDLGENDSFIVYRGRVLRS